MIKKDIPYSEGTASIGICFDVPKQRETVVIGSPENIKRYFTFGIKQDIDITTRKLGALVDEMNALAQAD